MVEEENLVSRRPKRSTAGNRMELALAELALEEPQEVEEDIDFVTGKEEDDIFESDFASTDEEAAQEDVDESDRVARDEERRERKIARTRIEKATAAAHARQRVTFNPDTSSSQSRSKPLKPKRRVSLGVVVDAETGEVIEGSTGAARAKRQSQRRHTVMNTSATVNRIKDAKEKRAAIPKKTKTVSRLPTQDELIARALDTEEGNINEHRDYLRLEEEKRAKARVVKKAIEGPVLRWISKKETVQVEIQLPPPPPPPSTTMNSNMYAANFSFVYTPGVGPGTVGTQAYSMPFYAYTPHPAQSFASKPQDASTSGTGSSTKPEVPSVPSASSRHQQPHQPQTQVPPQAQVLVQPSAQPSFPSAFFSYPSAPIAPLIAHRSEDVCKNYVIHELSQTLLSNPSWKETMSAMFGDHVRWDEVKVFTSKGRPLARPVRTCVITGQPAKYRDPRTNVPFADVGAYDILTKVLGREYAWCSALGCYVGASKVNSRVKDAGREAGCSEAVAGVVEVPEGGNVEEGTQDPEERTNKRRRTEAADG